MVAREMVLSELKYLIYFVQFIIKHETFMLDLTYHMCIISEVYKDSVMSRLKRLKCIYHIYGARRVSGLAFIRYAQS